MRKKTPIMLDRERYLLLTMSAMQDIEKALGKKITNLGEDIGIEDLIVYVWAGLKHEDPNLTKKDVLKLLDEYANMKIINEAINEAFNDFFGITKDIDEEKKIVVEN